MCTAYNEQRPRTNHYTSADLWSGGRALRQRGMGEAKLGSRILSWLYVGRPPGS